MTGNGSSTTPKTRATPLRRKLKRQLNPWAVDDDRYDHFKSLQIGNFPDGYPRLAAFMSSDINTRLYRQFDWERSRLLLHKQDRIAELSDELKALDKAEDSSRSPRVYSRRHDEKEAPCTRLHLLQRFGTELKEYDDLLLREHAIASLPKPTKRNFRTVFDWVYNEQPIVQEEYQYLYQRDDFVLLGEQQDEWVRSFAEKVSYLVVLPFTKIFLLSKKHRDDDDEKACPDFFEVSNYRTNLVVKLAISLALITLLMLPVVLLYDLNSPPGVKLTILLLFVAAFTVALSLMTNATRHEVCNLRGRAGGVFGQFAGCVEELVDRMPQGEVVS